MKDFQGRHNNGRGVGRRELVDVCPAGFLLAGDFGNARIDLPSKGEEIFGFHIPHLHGVRARSPPRLGFAAIISNARRA